MFDKTRIRETLLAMERADIAAARLKPNAAAQPEVLIASSEKLI